MTGVAQNMPHVTTSSFNTTLSINNKSKYPKVSSRDHMADGHELQTEVVSLEGKVQALTESVLAGTRVLGY